MHPRLGIGFGILDQSADRTGVDYRDQDGLCAVPVGVEIFKCWLCMAPEWDKSLDVVPESVLSPIELGVGDLKIGNGEAFISWVFHVSNLPQNACLTTPFPVFFSV